MNCLQAYPEVGEDSAGQTERNNGSTRFPLQRWSPRTRYDDKPRQVISYHDLPSVERAYQRVVKRFTLAYCLHGALPVPLVLNLLLEIGRRF